MGSVVVIVFFVHEENSGLELVGCSVFVCWACEETLLGLIPMMPESNGPALLEFISWVWNICSLTSLDFSAFSSLMDLCWMLKSTSLASMEQLNKPAACLPCLLPILCWNHVFAEQTSFIPQHVWLKTWKGYQLEPWWDCTEDSAEVCNGIGYSQDACQAVFADELLKPMCSTSHRSAALL